jgi:hypothetical protein
MSRSLSRPTHCRPGRPAFATSALQSKAAPTGRAARPASISVTRTDTCSNWRRQACGRAIDDFEAALARRAIASCNHCDALLGAETDPR